MLLKAAVDFTLNLWKIKPNPDAEVFFALASVCQKWKETITSRLWFGKALKKQLSSKCHDCITKMPQSLIKLNLLFVIRFCTNLGSGNGSKKLCSI